MDNKKIVIVEDDRAISDIIKYNVQKEGYTAYTAYDGEEGLALIEQVDPDLILLDIMMPKMDGLEVCRKVRKTRNTPIIMLTARAEEVDKVVGLEIGADDYVTKPFGVRELMARIRANLRRVENTQDIEQDENVISEGDLKIDIGKFEVQKRGEVIELTHLEFGLLKFLSAQKGQVFSRETLLSKVWGYEYYGDIRTIDVTVRRLREKIEDDPSKAEYVLTKRGAGYYFRG
ncbi:MAG TPA: response regulator transcription factor [Epulopiscium sp.]|nr:response regulator transcription factor [Candidatus Epulonipiscium sp.]